MSMRSEHEHNFGGAQNFREFKAAPAESWRGKKEKEHAKEWLQDFKDAIIAIERNKGRKDYDKAVFDAQHILGECPFEVPTEAATKSEPAAMSDQYYLEKYWKDPDQLVSYLKQSFVKYVEQAAETDPTITLNEFIQFEEDLAYVPHERIKDNITEHVRQKTPAGEALVEQQRKEVRQGKPLTQQEEQEKMQRIRNRITIATGKAGEHSKVLMEKVERERGDLAPNRTRFVDALSKQPEAKGFWGKLARKVGFGGEREAGDKVTATLGYNRALKLEVARIKKEYQDDADAELQEFSQEERTALSAYARKVVPQGNEEKLNDVVAAGWAEIERVVRGA